jgi:hypothetical protein
MPPRIAKLVECVGASRARKAGPKRSKRSSMSHFGTSEDINQVEKL